MKKIKVFVLFFLLVFSIELFYFNFLPLKDILLNMNNNDNINIVYDMTKAEYINWEETNNSKRSLSDPMIVLGNINKRINSISVKIVTTPSIDFADLFYTNENNEVFNEEHMIRNIGIQKGLIDFEINQFVNDIRIDLGDKSGINLKSISIIINPAKISISIARIVAMLLIGLIATGLSKLQKSPKYDV